MYIMLLQRTWYDVHWSAVPVFWMLRLRHDRLLSCISAGPSRGFPWNFVLGTFKKICREIPNLFKIGKNIGHFTLRHKYVLVFSATQIHHKSIFVKYSIILCCWQWHIAQHYTQVHCFIPITTMVRRADHNITSYVHCLPWLTYWRLFL
jgi:hypothetical protein